MSGATITLIEDGARDRYLVYLTAENGDQSFAYVVHAFYNPNDKKTYCYARWVPHRVNSHSNAVGLWVPEDRVCAAQWGFAGPVRCA